MNKYKLLAIDDQVDNLTTIKAIVKSQLKHCEIFTATSGAEGIELAIKESPDAILLDIIMPKMDGYEVCRRLKEHDSTKHIPIVMITAIKTDIDSRVKALDLGADAFLSKPIDPIELAAQIRVMLRIKTAEDKLREENVELGSDLKHQSGFSSSLFNNAGIPILVEDFSNLKKHLDKLKEKGIVDLDLYFDKNPNELKKCAALISITDFNAQTIEFYNLEDSNEFNKNIPDWFTSKSWAVFKKEIIALYKGDMNFKSEIELINPHGELMDLILNITVHPDSKETLKEVFVSFIDITPIKQAQNEVIISHKKFKSIFESANDAIFLMKGFKFESCNPKTLEIFNCEYDEIIGASPGDFSPILQPDGSKSKEKALKKMKAALKGKEQKFEWLHLKKGGDLFYSEISLTALKIDDEEYLQAIVRDISERKQFEIDLRNSEEMYKALYENAPLPYQSLNEDGSFRDVNPAWLESLGYDRDEVIGHFYKDFLHPDWQPLFEKRFPAFKKRGYVHNAHFKIKHKNGNYREISFEGCIGYNPDGSVRQTYCVFQDITERVKAEHALKESESHFRALFEYSPVPTWEEDFSEVKVEIDKLKKRKIKDYHAYFNQRPELVAELASKIKILEVNKPVLELHNAESKDDLLKGLTRIFSEDSYDTFIEELVAIAKGKNECSFDGKVKTLDGQDKFIHLNWVVVPGFEESLERVYVSTQDITDRLEASEALRKSEEKYRYLYDNAVIAMYTTSIDGKGINANDAGLRMLGYKDIQSFCHDFKVNTHYVNMEDRDKMIELIQNEGIVHGFQFEAQKTDGTKFWMEISLKLNKEEQILEAVGYDITENRKNKEAIEKAAREWQTTFDSINDVIWILDKNHKIIRSNKAAESFFAISKGEVVNKCCYNFVHKTTKPFDGCVLRKSLSSKKREQMTFQSNNKYYEITVDPILNDNNEFEGAVHVISDITERKLSEEALIKSEERFDLAMKAANDGLYDWNLVTNEVYFSERWKNMLGYEDHELESSLDTWKELTDPKERDSSLRKLEHGIKNKLTHYDVEFKMKHKDGHWINILSRAQLIYNNKGEAIRAVGIHSDITARNKAEEELRLALDKAEESDRLKSAFLATMSHELRTPLNAIIGFSDIISDDVSKEEILTFNKTINSSGKHLLNIVEDLFDITLIETGEMKILREKIDVSEIFQGIEDVIEIERQRSFKGHINLRKSIPQDCTNLTIDTDVSKVKQILLNLLKNAIKFTNTGEVYYGCQIDLIKRRHVLHFFVKDTGIGVPKEKQEFIFDIFRQVEDSHTRTYGGTGIGLSISKRLTELLGGEIWLESEEGSGSTFHFTLPLDNLKSSKLQSQKDSETVVTEVKKGSSLILVAEDVEASYEFLEVVLNKSGFKTIWAANGREAIEKCKENDEIELILMDINMPVMNGYEATRVIKEFRPNLPIIAQTAYAIAGDKDKSLNAGCDDYVTKPIKRDILIQKIRALIE